MANIAVLGPEGTFTDEAARRRLKKGDFRYYNSVTLVFEAVSSGECEKGVVPIENSSEGSVSETIECLKNYELNITGELYHQIRHVLAGTGKLEDIKTVMTHRQAYAQCRGKVSKLLKNPDIITKAPSGSDLSTAGAIEIVARKKDPSVAAIGSESTAKRYGLKVLAPNLSDMEDNETRFFVISKEEAERTGKDKTSIIAAVKDEAGALYELLGVFAKAGINLTKIESRPSKDRKWEYMFLIDFEGHKEDSEVKKVLKEVEERTTYYKLLGSYPKG